MVKGKKGCQKRILPVMCAILTVSAGNVFQSEAQISIQKEYEVQAEDRDGVPQFICSEKVTDREDLPVPEPVIEGENEELCELKAWTIREETGEARNQKIRQEVKRSKDFGEKDADEVLKLEVVDDMTGARSEAVCQKVDETLLEERWEDDGEITVVCCLGKNYCGPEESDGSVRALYSKPQPPVKECEYALLQAGISEEDFKLEEAFWSGEPYEDEEGRLCRLIQVKGKKKIREYQVTYEGMAEFPGITSYWYEAVYEVSNAETAGQDDEVDVPDNQDQEMKENQDSQSGERTDGEDQMNKEGLDNEQEIRDFAGRNGAFSGWAEKGKEIRKKIIKIVTETKGFTISLSLLGLIAAAVFGGISVRRRKKK